MEMFKCEYENYCGDQPMVNLDVIYRACRIYENGDL